MFLNLCTDVYCQRLERSDLEREETQLKMRRMTTGMRLMSWIFEVTYRSRNECLTFLRISSSFSVFSSSRYSWPCTPDAPVPGYTGYRDPGPAPGPFERFARYDILLDLLVDLDLDLEDFCLLRSLLSFPPRHARLSSLRNVSFYSRNLCFPK